MPEVDGVELEVGSGSTAGLTGRGTTRAQLRPAEAVAALEEDPWLRVRWQGRFSHLCVDAFQEVDAPELRLIRIVAAPEENLFVVGDDDQP